MFTSLKPERYTGPVNGRDRRENKPPDFVLPRKEDNEEQYDAFLQYLSIYQEQERAETATMVYACPNCQVRIANEEDMVTRPFIWSEEELSLNAVFRKTSNLVANGAFVCCYRCREKLFDYCFEDPFLLTIPMFTSKNEKTLLKRAYRMLSLILTTGGALFDFVNWEPCKEDFRFLSVEEQLSILNADTYPRDKGDPVVKEVLRKMRTVCDNFGDGKQLEQRKVIAFDMSTTPYVRYHELNLHNMESTALKRLQEVHSDFDAEFVIAQELEKHDAFSVDKVYDVALLFRTGLHKHAFIVHTDYNDHFLNGGKFHILPWLVSGGNFIFADWGSYLDDLSPSDTFDAASCTRLMAIEHVGTNKQPSFAKLLADGHFLGSWSYKSDGAANEPTQKMLQKIETALAGNLLYPNWLFLHDYPSATFTDPKRSTGRKPFALGTNDVYPHFKRTTYVYRNSQMCRLARPVSRFVDFLIKNQIVQVQAYLT